MRKVIQCVPNFSEGRRQEVVDAIVQAVQRTAVDVIDYSLDHDHNRSVVTFVGEPPDIAVAALAAARKAVELIDLNQHIGGHPRIGALDVLPIVPVRNVSVQEAVELSRTIGRNIADTLHIPVYFYEWSALTSNRVNLADVRRGGFEGLREHGLTGDRTPDLGPHHVHPTAGAMAIGARGPLIAYNVNLTTSDVRIAAAIAGKIRYMRDSGQGMEGVKAIAVHLESLDIAQVSVNITKPDKVGLFEVYDFIHTEACAAGVEVLESELIGAIRLESAVDALKRALAFTDLSPKRIIDQ